MALNRDNFTTKTVDILAKRVGYLCSNPNCRRHTVGPNSEKGKATIVGVAAHITAASVGGPRFDSNLTVEERKDIDNGIWLCTNCSVLIDKDPKAFPVELLKDWKKFSESEMNKKLLGFTVEKKEVPFLEADLIWANSQRWNRGFSSKNKELYGEYIVLGDNKPVIFWELVWNFHFAIFNNSNVLAKNVKVEQISGNELSSLDSLPKINNLPPYADIKLKAQFVGFHEGFSHEADELIKPKVPEVVQGLQIKISYEDQEGNYYSTIFRVEGEEIRNEKG